MVWQPNGDDKWDGTVGGQLAAVIARRPTGVFVCYAWLEVQRKWIDREAASYTEAQKWCEAEYECGAAVAYVGC